MTIKTAFIFAAGFGKRIAAVSGGLPKPLIEFNEKALIDWAIDNFFSFGIERIIVNLHYKADIIKNHLDKYKAHNIIILEEKELLQTGGALINAAPLIMQNSWGRYIFTTNVDVLWNNNGIILKLEKKFQELKKQGKVVDILMLFTHKLESGATSFDVLENNEVIMADGFPYMFSGIQIIDLNVVLRHHMQYNNKKIFSLSEIYIDSKTQNGKLNNVYGVLCDGVYHVGTEKEFTFFENLGILR